MIVVVVTGMVGQGGMLIRAGAVQVNFDSNENADY